MNRVVVLMTAVAVALAAGSAAPAKMEGRLFGLLGTTGAQEVVELDPDTLRALPGRRVRIGPGGPAASWSHDPTRHFLALTVGQRLRVVDLWSLRVLRTARLGVYAKPAGVLWLRSDRIVVLQKNAGLVEVVLFDAKRLTVISRKRMADGHVVDSERTQSEVALLLAPAYTIGPTRLVIVGAAGEIREVQLTRITAGTRWNDMDPPLGEHVAPALAADHARRSLYVISPDGVAAEIGLDEPTLRYRTLRGSYAKLTAGASREAFVADGRLVVSGRTDTISATASGPVGTSTGIGIELVDLTSWETTRVPSTISSIAPWRDAIVATGGTWHSEHGHRGTGLAVYGLDGKLRLRVLDGKRVWLVAVRGDRAYAHIDGDSRLTQIDLLAGFLTLRRTNLPWLLIEQGSPIWF